MSGRTWKNIDPTIAEKIKDYLLKNGGYKQEVNHHMKNGELDFLILSLPITKAGLFIAHRQSQEILQCLTLGSI